MSLNKLAGTPEAVQLFIDLGAEPLGRYTVGLIELLIAILYLIPRLVWLGSIVGFFTMIGALLSHTKLGIELNGDGGATFIMGVIVFLSSIVILILRKQQMPFLNKPIN